MKVIALTGGPGGGKSELLDSTREDPVLRRFVVVAEEAIRATRFVRLSRRSREFQCALVAIQAGVEHSLLGILAEAEKRVILTDRGTLDPCAFWQSFGNSRQSFFEMTGTTLKDHYRRYDLVIHLESSAVRMPEAYLRYPRAYRPEDIAEAARLDRYLGALWSSHPRYVKIEGTDDVAEKLSRGLALLRRLLA